MLTNSLVFMPSLWPKVMPVLDFILPPQARFWLNHQVVLVVNPVGEAVAFPSRWKCVSPVVDFRSQARTELLGFSSPGEAEKAIPGSRLESSRAFVVPEKKWCRDESFLSFLGTALSWDLPPAEIYLLAERLFLIREALSERVAAPVFAGRPLHCADLVAKPAANTVYLKGWWRNCHGDPVRLTAVAPEGERCELLDSLFRFSRTDIVPAYAGDEYTGFTVFFRLDRPNPLRAGWRLEIETIDGFVADMAAPEAVGDPGEILSAVLPDFEIERPPQPQGSAEHVHRCVSHLLADRSRSYRLVQELQFGPLAQRPVLSIIIPLYGRVDLMEHQLAQFALDPTWARCDLIYVLDSPEQWQRVAWRAEWLARLYNLSLRVVKSSQSGGYAAASNLGAMVARSELLLFLNSDILPVSPGWIDRMIGAYRRRSGIGALGAKLLFEDDSIQHAGVGFSYCQDGFGWNTLPFYKGLHRNHPEANQARIIPAVTGACLMVDRKLFQKAGGFDQGYIQGDFEDMDLCLRLRALGCQNWYDPEVELYHLEGVSYPMDRRILHAAYNRWLHSRKWAGVIEKLIDENDAPSAQNSRLFA